MRNRTVQIGVCALWGNQSHEFFPPFSVSTEIGEVVAAPHELLFSVIYRKSELCMDALLKQKSRKDPFCCPE